MVAVGLLASAGGAAAQDIMTAVKSDDWATADALAAQMPDPVARKLVTYWRLLAPHGGTASEIAAFMATSPDWPLETILARRRDEAVVAEPDDATAATVCDGARPPVANADALLRCADAYAHLGRAADSAASVRAAWLGGPSNADWEARFMARRGGQIGVADQWERFDRLAWSDVAGAKRQELRLDGAGRQAAEARLAFKRDDPAAPAMLSVLPASTQDDPDLFLDRARWLRRASRDDEAESLWLARGAAAESAATGSHLPAFWAERSLLARRRLRATDAQGAYALADDTALRAGEAAADARFLAGFIALRKLGDLARAETQFTALAGLTKAAITRSRAAYWLGRTDAARGDMMAATADYRRAAAYPNTFYGQLAIIALGDADKLGWLIRQNHDPQAEPDQALAFAGRELARAASLAAAWGEPRRAGGFLYRISQVAPDAPDKALAAKLATGLGLPQTAISIARWAGRDGVVLLGTGWPAAATIPADAGIDQGFALGIIRQESSFDTQTLSPVGARGLMQLMPGTAAEVAGQLGLPANVAALTADPDYNIRLGTAFLRKLLDRYGGSIPLAAAAYNAGPGRVAEWLAANGDPRTPAVDMIDWIELIPIEETRNYVQRVIENTVIYRAEQGQDDPHPLAQWLR